MEKWEGVWLTYFNPSPQRLQRLIARHQPKNLYLSVNQYLRYKEHNLFSNILLNKFGLIDIDGQNFNDKLETKQYFIQINEILKEADIHVAENVCTNNTIGGYQIIIVPCCYKKFCNLIQNHPQHFSKVDTRVFDEKRVRRMPQSYNGNRGSFSYYVDDLGNPKDLNNSLIQDKLTARYSVRLSYEVQTTGMSQDETDDKGVAFNAQHISPCKTKRGQENSSNLPSHFIVRQISNSVFGTKGLHIPYIKFNYKPSPRRIRRLQKFYNLGDIYLFKFHLGYALLSLKVFDAPRLRKIYKAFKSYSSYNEFIKFNQNWIFMSNIIDLNNNQKINSFEFLELYPAESNGCYSNTHLYWMTQSSFWQSKVYSNSIGNKSEIYIAEFERDLQCTNRTSANADITKTGITTKAESV